MSSRQMSQHRIADVSFRAERIDCTCGVVVTAPADAVIPDRHEPLGLAWSDHRRTNGEAVLSVGKVMSFRRRT